LLQLHKDAGKMEIIAGDRFLQWSWTVVDRRLFCRLL